MRLNDRRKGKIGGSGVPVAGGFTENPPNVSICVVQRVHLGNVGLVMTNKVVAMAMIPGIVRRGKSRRTDLSYAKYGQATWQWWCDKNEIDFVVFDEPLEDKLFSDMPPTIQRWLIPELLIRQRGAGTRVALVDADTMIRPDTPDFLDRTNKFSAVLGRNAPWIERSIAAFRPFFPDVVLTSRDYLNSGVTVVGEGQLDAIRSFLAFVSERWEELNRTILSANFGTDQTVLNFVLKRENVDIDYMPRVFNLVHCFPFTSELFSIENSPLPDPIKFASIAFSRPDAFDFCNQAYIWHFSNVVAMRGLVMSEVWRRVSSSYPGAELVEIPKTRSSHTP